MWGVLWEGGVGGGKGGGGGGGGAKERKLRRFKPPKVAGKSIVALINLEKGGGPRRRVSAS